MKKTILSAILCVALAACSDWLDVKPSDRVSEEAAFSSVAGFKKALNGIYIELNDDALYGKTLTCEMTEILAQRYEVSPDNKNLQSLFTYDYTSSYVMDRVERTWQKAYNLIANANLLVKNCDERREVLPDDYYRMVKGEALALRGMLHFDLYRLFGPIYTRDSLLAAIPYYSEFVLSVNPPLPGNAFMQNVIADLKAAEELLSDDPIVKYGVAGDPYDKFKADRTLRLNYYAVQALLSRVYMYMGDEDNALAYAQAVLEVHPRLFPFTDRTKAAMGNNPDRVFSSELLFALQNKNLNSLYNTMFNGEVLKSESFLGLRDDVIWYIFQEGESDMRVLSFMRSKVVVSGTEYWLFNKFQHNTTDSLYTQMMPMIRITEMHLNATEVLVNQGRRSEASTLFDGLRQARGLSKVGSWVSYYYEDEWLKEFVGEGQLFFYYKRKAMDYIGSALEPWEMDMPLKNYVLPIPDGEAKYN